MKHLIWAALALTLALAGTSAAAANRAINGNYYDSGEFSDLHPEEAYPNAIPPLASPGPYAGMIEQVQQKLHTLGFDAGPVNGEFGSKTQAALAQFQRSASLPVSGALDAPTLQALGVAPEPQASD